MIDLLGFGGVMGTAMSMTPSQMLSTVMSSLLRARINSTRSACAASAKRSASAPFVQSNPTSPSVSATAASRVSKPDWEMEEDRKDTARTLNWKHGSTH